MFQRVAIDAFALSPELVQVFKEVRDDRAFARSRFNVLGGGLAGAAAYYADKSSPQVVIVEEDDDDATMLERLGALAEVCVPGTKVLVIGTLNDIRLYRTLVSQGVSEYLLKPVSARQLVDAVAGLFADPGAVPKGRTIAFWGACGGAGSSTLAQNVAWSLSQHLDDDVVYVDFDVAFGTSLLAFNIEAKQTIADALAHPERLDDVLMERFMVAYDDRLRILASPGTPAAAQAVLPEAVERVVDLAGRMGAVAVLDLPRVWADWTRDVLAAADEVVITATADLASLRDVKAMVEILAAKRGGAQAPRLVLNKLDAYRKTQIAPKDFDEALGMSPVQVIAFDPMLFGDAANSGQMLSETQGTHKAVEQIRLLAMLLAGRSPAAGKPAKAKTEAKASFLGWLRR